ncbi:cytochrome d ubiquinol oxidase subunit II [Kribbella sp. NPDC051620]|uniref:cytochrome d ubiquinol oxidase subunit II n=1 Tax=Kribbella sp. NPDC051620 TaxID=3364120 RepID=UPI0037A35696
MELTTVWFLVIAGLWIGYFVLEGFDFGVGILLRVLGRDEPERRAVITTIGPVWDGNEVWLIVAGAMTFAAFPEWYATLFSAFYLPLFAILVALILRGVALEYRGKRDDLPWRNRMDTIITVSSLLLPLLWGIAFANLVRGLPLDASHEFVGNLGTLLNPFALLGGVAFTALFVAHGAIFLALRTTDDLRDRANRLASIAGLAAAVLVASFLAWAQAMRGNLASTMVAALAAIVLLAGLAANRPIHLRPLAQPAGQPSEAKAPGAAASAHPSRREGWAFAGTALAVALGVASLFMAMFPAVMASTLDAGWSLTVANASSTPYTLKVLTVIAAIFLPLVMLYQGWTYWVFKKRISVERVAVS